MKDAQNLTSARSTIVYCLLIGLFASMGQANASACRTSPKSELTADKLTELSLEELMQLEVTSLGKKAQSLSETAAPVFVITNRDIRRSGVTTIADALRMAPGLHVSKLNSHAWAVSARGFNGFFANQMLVLIDGRNVYSSTFGGVYWDAQDTLLEDIERIEVIRGPAGAIWGSNAVNGVINIITRCTEDTQGGFLTAGIGKEDKGFVGYRHGGKIGDQGFYRAYFKAYEHDGYQNNGSLQDAWHGLQAGFRTDFNLRRGGQLRVSGDIYRQRNDSFYLLNNVSAREKVRGGNLMARWETQLDNGSHLTIQSHLDHTRRSSDIADLSVDTFDFDFQHRFNWSRNNEFTWGFGYRHTEDDIVDKPQIQFNPPSETYELFTAFIQNQWWSDNREFSVILGSKFEHNDFTGSETQPSVRAIWHARDNLSFWAAASHAIHTVSRAFTAVEATAVSVPPFLLVQQVGNLNADANKADVFELGMRGQAGANFNWDVDLFYAKYSDLLDTQTNISLFPNGFLAPPFQLTQTTGFNEASATTSGLEVTLNWQATDKLRLMAAYTHLHIDADSDQDPFYKFNLENQNPSHQLSLRASYDWADNLDLDVWLRHVSSRKYKFFDVVAGTPIDQLPSNHIDSHTGVDARLAWRIKKDVELSLVGQNLLEPEHTEFGPDISNVHATNVERNLFLQLRWNIN